MKHKMRHKITLVLCSLLTLAIYQLNQRLVLSQASNTCGNLYINGSTSTVSVPVSGVASVTIAIPSGTAQPISKIVVRTNGQEIGRAQPNSSNFSWQMPWITSYHINGSFSVDAVVSYADATPSCITSDMPVTLANPTISNLTATANPPSWQGPMSFSIPFSVQAPVPNIPDINRYGIFQWGTTIGSINANPSLNQAQFSSGQTVGTGTIVVQVKYGGDTANVTIPVTVKSPDAPLPTPAATNTNGSPGTAADTTSTTPEAIARVATLQNNPVVQNCTITALGDARFKAINTGEVRPTPLEIKNFTACFASSNYILPSNFSPVAPASVKDLPQTKDLQMNKPENVTKHDADGKTVGLKFGGKAKPGSVVLLYVFSDPLVLTTTADKDGNWTYTLEDPIESGSHEVYTVVDRGDGVYERSNPVSFFLGTATAAEANPNGLSLSLAEQPSPTQSNRSLIVYATGAVGIVVLVLLALFLFMKRRGRKAPAPLSAQSTEMPTDSAEETFITPTQQTETTEPEEITHTTEEVPTEEQPTIASEEPDQQPKI